MPTIAEYKAMVNREYLQPAAPSRSAFDVATPSDAAAAASTGATPSPTPPPPSSCARTGQKFVWYAMTFPTPDRFDKNVAENEQMQRVFHVEATFPHNKKYTGPSDPMGLLYRARIFLIYCRMRGINNNHVGLVLPALMADDEAYEHCLDLYDNARDKTDWRTMLDGMMAHCEGPAAVVPRLAKEPGLSLQDVLDEAPGKRTANDAIGILYTRMARLHRAEQPVAAKRDPKTLYDQFLAALEQHPDTSEAAIMLQIRGDCDADECNVTKFVMSVRAYLKCKEDARLLREKTALKKTAAQPQPQEKTASQQQQQPISVLSQRTMPSVAASPFTNPAAPSLFSALPGFRRG